jgi:hypothetical protein
LPCKRFAVPLFDDAKNRALVRIAERHCDDLARKLLRLIGRHAAGFENLSYPLPDHAHARLIEGARKIGETPPFRDDQAI